MKIQSLTAAAIFTLITLPTGGVDTANAAEVKLLSAEVMRHAINELSADFERTTGHKLTISYDSAKAVTDRIKSNEIADVAIIQKAAVEALSDQGKIARGTLVTLARSGLALAVRKGAPKPDLSSVEALKRSLLATKSIAYPDPRRGAASGIQFVHIIEKLGIAQEINAKAKLRSPSLPSPEAEIVITQPAEILAEANLDLVGWLPDELQDYDAFTWVAGITANARQPDAAKALIRFLISPSAAAVIKKRGMEPHPS